LDSLRLQSEFNYFQLFISEFPEVPNIYSEAGFYELHRSATGIKVP
jgi:hypothetical protein